MTRRDEVLRVRGGHPLSGRICIGGSKNATLPILAACLLTAKPVFVRNVAEVTDTQVMLQILSALGCRVEGEKITAASVTSDVPEELARRMRASIVLLGPLLARTGRVRLPKPGGDDIGMRRVEQHIAGLRRMGAEIEETETEIIGHADRLRGTRVVLDMPTVTGTENLIMAATLAEGRTEILNAAREPHVQDVTRMLNAIGANIVGAGTHEIVVEGVEELGGGEHSVTTDYLEAGTYALAVAAAGGDVFLECSPVEDLPMVLLKLEEAGVGVEVSGDVLHIVRDPSWPVKAVDLTTWVHPGFPTDLQAQYMALMTQAQGTAVVSEFLFENRFQHVPELWMMGARIEQLNSRAAVVHGPTQLTGADLTIPDIRSGAALVIAALCAHGESVLHHAWHVNRGYPDLVGKLTELGADLGTDPTQDVPSTPSKGSGTFE
ncbi:MAG: UDP-N-acetylglucosamine 1-carboxyvinyltransferase [Candidatus Dormibacteraeota bacterium]|nr:UDP-N-acetylglucosamine 1-carboxyvinyltransferase [Candidatus Dormibacteraeota bacterium]